MSRSRHHNTGIASNIIYNPHDTIPLDSIGSKITVEFPATEIRSADYRNNPLGHVDDYVSNKKTMAAEMLRRQNLNQQLNHKNAFYIDPHNSDTRKDSLSVFNHARVYKLQTDDANARASIRSVENYRNLEKKELRVRDFLRKTEEIVEERKSRLFHDQAEHRIEHVISNI